MKRRRFLAATSAAAFAARASPAHGFEPTEWRHAGPSLNGTDVIADLPPGEAPRSLPEALAAINSNLQRVRNFGAPRDGLGLCVFATLDMLARYQNVPELIGIIHKIPEGGGWPEKVKRVVAEHAPRIEVAQYEGTDPSFIDECMRNGWPCGSTYGYGEFYNNQTIPHAVMNAGLDKDWCDIIDNNDPLVFTRMRRAEYLKRWTHLGGQGWAYALIAPSPPPAPRN